MSKALLELNKFKDFVPLAAYIFAEAAHAGQFRADNTTNYRVHLNEVAHQLDDWGICDDFHFSVALLHDTIEKTSATYSQLYTIFGKKIADAVKLISHNENEMTEQQYFELNKNNVVKLADHICNTKFFMSNKIRDPKKYYTKGMVLINNFRNKSPYKEAIEEIENNLNN
jgi:(p)ppGpp synthase/HD superfamily hydrolase